jgi:phasin family protein
MYSTPAQFAELQKSNVDTFNAYGNAFFNAAERLAQLQLATGRALLRDAADAVQSVAGVKDPQEFFALSQGSTQPALEKLVGYSRSLYGIASGVGAEMTKIVEAQISEGNRRIAEFIDTAAKNAPAGSESAVAWMKNAVAAGNNAFDSFNRAAQQAVEVSESNFAAVAAAASDSIKPKARKAA